MRGNVILTCNKSQTAVVKKPSRGIYVSVAIAALYFADRICEALSSEMLISQHPSKVITLMNRRIDIHPVE